METSLRGLQEPGRPCAFSIGPWSHSAFSVVNEHTQARLNHQKQKLTQKSKLDESRLPARVQRSQGLLDEAPLSVLHLIFLVTDWFILFYFPNMWSYSFFTSHVAHYMVNACNPVLHSIAAVSHVPGSAESKLNCTIPVVSRNALTICGSFDEMYFTLSLVEHCRPWLRNIGSNIRVQMRWHSQCVVPCKCVYIANQL